MLFSMREKKHLEMEFSCPIIAIKPFTFWHFESRAWLWFKPLCRNKSWVLHQVTIFNTLFSQSELKESLYSIMFKISQTSKSTPRQHYSYFCINPSLRDNTPVRAFFRNTLLSNHVVPRELKMMQQEPQQGQSSYGLMIRSVPISHMEAI